MQIAVPVELIRTSRNLPHQVFDEMMAGWIPHDKWLSRCYKSLVSIIEFIARKPWIITQTGLRIKAKAAKASFFRRKQRGSSSRSCCLCRLRTRVAVSSKCLQEYLTWFAFILWAADPPFSELYWPNSCGPRRKRRANGRTPCWSHSSSSRFLYSSFWMFQSSTHQIPFTRRPLTWLGIWVILLFYFTFIYI